MITGEVEAVDRKQKIRDRYKGVDISELEVIPAKIIEDLETSSVIRRVDRKSTRLNSSHRLESRMPSSA